MGDRSPWPNLTAELLYLIFSANSNMFTIKRLSGETSALSNLRIASQVCHSWRYLVINSATLWSHALDLDDLLEHDQPANIVIANPILFKLFPTYRYEAEESEDEEICEEDQDTPFGYDLGRRTPWVKEVLQRAANALLWIKAECIAEPENVNFALRLISREWRRIEVLKGIIKISEEGHQCIRSSLKRPAPFLRKLQVTISAGRKYVKLMPQQLFRGHAPFLTHLTLSEFGIQPVQGVLPTNSDFLGKIQWLEVTYLHTITDLLSILSYMSSLQYLHVTNSYLTKEKDILTSYSECASVSLPFLISLKLRNDVKCSLLLLKQLKLASKCNMSLTVDGIHMNDLTGDLALDWTTITNLSAQFFDTYRPTHIELHLYEDWVELYSSASKILGQYDDEEAMSDGENPLFAFSGCCRGSLADHSRNADVDALMRMLSIPELSTATALSFDVSFVERNIPVSFYSHTSPILSDIGVLSTNAFTFSELFDRHRHHLHDQTDDKFPGVLFPKLHTLMLEDFSTGFGGMAEVLNLISNLQIMAEEGRPIEILDLTRIARRRLPQCEMFDELADMKLRWIDPDGGDVLEYICGSGHPEILPTEGEDMEFECDYIGVDVDDLVFE